MIITLKESDAFKYLGPILDPALTMEAATKHICKKINAAHQTVAAVAHSSLRYDTPAILRGIRSSPLVLFRIWQSCVLSFATEHLRYLVNNTQIETVERTLINSLQRTLHCFTPSQIIMLELGVPPLALQQAAQLIALHFRFTVTHTHTISAHLYKLRCTRRLGNSHPPQSFENRIEKAHRKLQLYSILGYPNPPPIPHAVAQAKPANKGKSYRGQIPKTLAQQGMASTRPSIIRQLTQPSHRHPHLKNPRTLPSAPPLTLFQPL